LRILFLTQVLPYPLDAGPKVRSYYTLRHLARRGQAVTLVSFVRATDRPEAVAHMGELCEQVVTVPMPRARWRDALALARSALTGEPLLITRDRVPAMHARLREIAGRQPFDLVHADQLWMAPYALAAAAAQPRAPRLVLDQHNAVYLVPQRLAASARNPVARLGYAREARRMAAYEAAICRRFDAVVTLTAEDRQSLLQLYAGAEPPALDAIIPICLDPASVPLARRQPGSRDLLFVGGMHWAPNAEGVVWFGRQVLPLVRAAEPAARLVAVGRQPPVAVLAGAPEGSLCFPGYVEDLEAYWQACAVFVVPLHAGGGMRVKILDAWSRGVPIVSTTIGAEGLAVADGENLLLADTAADFAAAVQRVLADPALAERLARGGRATVERHYDWRAIYPAWDAVYAGRPAAPPG
jgi:glycosyltransferase involved in cell wall biosynthesis